MKINELPQGFASVFRRRRQGFTRGAHLVGARIGDETFIVFYDDQPREV